MAMTEEERRQKRNEASRRCYLKRKAAMAAMNRAGGVRPKAKAVEVRPAKKGALFGAGKKDPSAQALRAVEKLAKKFAKPVSQAKAMVKEAAQVLADLYRTGDEKAVAKALKTIEKELSLVVGTDPENPARKNVSMAVGAKAFKVPKPKEERKPAAAEPPAAPPPEEEPDGEKEKIVTVDPALLTGIEEGTVTADDVDSAEREDGGDAEEDEEDEDTPSWKGKDPDDMTDEELEEYEKARDEEIAAGYETGRFGMYDEMGQQGAFDD